MDPNPEITTSTHIDDLPNEVLHEIVKVATPSKPASLLEALRAASSLSASYRWRAVTVYGLYEAPFSVTCGPWATKMLGSWTPREQQQNEFQIPKLVLQLDNASSRSPRWNDGPNSGRPPPYQIAFQVLEELEVHLLPSFRALRPLHDTLIDTPLRFLKIRGTKLCGTGRLFKDLDETKFSCLTQFFMLQCFVSPDEFAAILHCMPRLEDCRISFIGRERESDTCTQAIESTSLVSLSISFLDLPRTLPWPFIISLPNLTTLICIGTKPFQRALPFSLPSLRTVVGYIVGTRADRQADLTAFLEKCPHLEKLVIPTELWVVSSFFDKISSGVLVPHLRELQCGPSLLNADSLVAFLRKKGFVDTPRPSGVEPDFTSPVCAFRRVSFCGLPSVSQKEIQDRLKGVTSVVGFVVHEIGYYQYVIRGWLN
ncbi:hypothetical protein BDN72DRAFT_897571 [Pluteus cervinus]|uniref:Uncharacterized protein n=1 Tax=Pluteus cervinus TaxID=181527 RepID=A0ACD3ATR4_9AGAR|nr:hypothetical protein BDN72DRAFT_897571 [Pluteus cervinus]